MSQIACSTILCSACFWLELTLVVPVRPSSAASTSTPEKWNFAIVFRRSGNSRSFIGVVRSLVMPARLQMQSASRKPRIPESSVIDFEIWLTADGKSLGTWYSSSNHVFGVLSSEGRPKAAVEDNEGLVGRIVTGARSPTMSSAFRASARAFAHGPIPPPSLAQLCGASDVIAVGRVVAVLRNDHSPVGSKSFEQHTVYVFGVEEYLKSGSAWMQPILKVWQSGGRLPWTNFDSSAKGVGWEVTSDPMLKVGERYILFLHSFRNDAEARKLGYVPATVNGISGKDAELDEYRAVEPIRGKVLLKDGKARMPNDPGSPGYITWSFESGPQIIGVRERDAVSVIRKTVASTPVN